MIRSLAILLISSTSLLLYIISIAHFLREDKASTALSIAVGIPFLTGIILLFF